MLGVSIRYFSRSLKKIISTFLGLVEIEDGTAVSIVNGIKGLLAEIKINLKKLIGIGTDNASVMTGTNSGVHALLKNATENNYNQLQNLSKTEKLLQPNNLKTNYLIPPDTVHKCRVCLERGTKPIYGSPTLPDISASLQLFGGIKIKKTDSFSKYVCECCYSFLQFAVTFREKALKSDLMMQQGLLDNGIKESISENIGSVNKESQDLGKKLFSCKTCIKDFACRICENRFGTRKALLRHEIRAHKRSKMAKGRLPLYLQAEYKT
ncbi:unnamed protein product [Parnassius mnemosyne]|uniref:C2H2-type domain-containing protein n=1 Tax=Parnassius mnemosyne TaxID=213953 RepID=A0AAV1LK25_9NEOP